MLIVKPKQKFKSNPVKFIYFSVYYYKKNINTW